MRTERTQTFPAQVEQWEEALAFLQGILEEAEAPLKAQMQIRVAAEELFVNIAHYAYKDTQLPQEERTAQMRVVIEDTPEGRVAAITLSDRGIPYDPLSKPDPDMTLSADEREIGGLGIYMVRKSVDEMRYEYKNGRNIVSIVKRW